MHLEDILVPISLFISLAIVLYKFIESRHNEHMAMIERGMAVAPRRPEKRAASTRYLTWGLLSLFVSIGFIAGLVLEVNYDVDGAIVPALMIMAGGIALMATYGIVRREEEKRERRGLEG
jgi:hypothetical protein